MKILVTGGCGFIGGSFIRHVLNHTDAEIINVDKLTYAATSPIEYKEFGGSGYNYTGKNELKFKIKEIFFKKKMKKKIKKNETT